MPTPAHTVVPPQSGRALRIERGDLVTVIDPEGQQVADLWAFVEGESLDWLSTSQTRDITERMFPAIGEVFYSDRGIPLLALVADHSPGRHDMLFPACNRPMYERYGCPNHPNCRDNLLGALANESIVPPCVPDPVDLFQNSPPQADGRLEVLPSINPPGASIVFRAEADLLLVVTACAVDFHPTNGGRCTEIHIVVEQGLPS
jgi:uncharacterized protein YcgI (DUF1989 family)